MDRFRFLKWKVYIDSQDLFSIILILVKELPKEYRFELGSQMIKAALSVVLNIAEGSGKNSDKELNRFIDIALGSLYETLAVADSLKMNKLITNDKFNDIFGRINIIANQLGGFKKKLMARK